MDCCGHGHVLTRRRWMWSTLTSVAAMVGGGVEPRGSTAAAQTDFLDSLPLRAISRRSDFPLRSLRGARPTTIYLCLPVGRMESHYRWLRLIVQLACTVLEKMGTYPRDRPPILFMMEEFATLGHMEIMERAAAYFSAITGTPCASRVIFTGAARPFTKRLPSSWGRADHAMNQA